MRWFFCILFCLCACQKAPRAPLAHFSGSAFDIGYHIQLGAKLSEEEESDVASAIQSIFTQVHEIFNHWNPDSEVTSLNAHPQMSPFKPSDQLMQLIKFSSTLNVITQGHFDPATGRLIEALKEETEGGDYGWDQLNIVDKELIKASNIHLDFDGVIKGHAVDLLVTKLASMGYENIYVEWGGEIRTIGQHPAKRPWRVLVRGSKDLKIELTEGALATSGTYEQRYDDKTHIIDPRSGLALNAMHPITSVTVKAPSCALADALATALMVFDTPQQATLFAEKLKTSLPEITVWINAAEYEDSHL